MQSDSKRPKRRTDGEHSGFLSSCIYSFSFKLNHKYIKSAVDPKGYITCWHRKPPLRMFWVAICWSKVKKWAGKKKKKKTKNFPQYRVQQTKIHDSGHKLLKYRTLKIDYFPISIHSSIFIIIISTSPAQCRQGSRAYPGSYRRKAGNNPEWGTNPSQYDHLPVHQHSTIFFLSAGRLMWHWDWG